MENPASGSLVDIALTDVLQVLSINRKTCTLYLKKGSERGEISLFEGQIVDSKSGDRRGEPAFFYLLGWERADFFISSTPNPGIEPSISRDLHVLILEWLEKRESLKEDSGHERKDQASPSIKPEQEHAVDQPAISENVSPHPPKTIEDPEIYTFLKTLESLGLIRSLP